jgi:hypothetical protein
MARDRAALLAELADDFMENGGSWQDPVWMLRNGMLSITASAYPPEDPREVHFSAAWTDVTIVCKRPYQRDASQPR